MRKAIFRLHGIGANRLSALMICALAALVIAGAFPADASQSGRRIPKRPKQTDPVPAEKSESPDDSTKADTDRNLIPVRVSKNLPGVMSAPYLAAYVVEGCVSRLKSAPSLDVTTGGDLNRKEASDYAKASTDIFVAWLEPELDRLDPNRNDPVYDDSVRVRYVLFEPGTGKMKTHGMVYMRPYRPRLGGVGVPLPLPRGMSTIESHLRQAGEDAADRMLDALGAGATRRDD